MRRVKGLNVKVMSDSESGFVSVDWHCPYCGMFNAGFYNYKNKNDLLSCDFEIDHECDNCYKMVTIECTDSEPL